MKKKLFLFTIFISLPIYSQTYAEIDKFIIGMKKPKLTEKNTTDIALYITEKYDADSLKARAIYTFVANYFEYDMDAADDGFATATSTGDAVCKQYAQLFTKMCDAVGLNSRYITGWSKASVKDIGKMNKKSYHAWNMVEIDGRWRPIDCTWGSGYMDAKTKEFVHKINDGYFMGNLKAFSLTHHPDSGFQYICPVLQSQQSFINSALYYPINFPKGVTLIPSSQNQLEISVANPKLELKYEGEFPQGKWKYSDLKGKVIKDINATVKDGVITIEFKEAIEITSYMTILFNDKPMVTMPLF